MEVDQAHQPNQLVQPDQPDQLDQPVVHETPTRHDEVNVAQVHQTMTMMMTIPRIVDQAHMTAVPEAVDTYEEHSTLLDMVRRIHHQRIATQRVRTPIQRARIPIQRLRIAMDLVHQIMMMMIVKMMMTHPVLVGHLDQDDQTIAADHPDHQDGRTIAVDHLVQVDHAQAVAVDQVHFQVLLKASRLPLTCPISPLVLK